MPGSGSSGFALELPDHKALTLAEIAEIAQESNRTAHSLIRNAVNNVLYTVSTTATVLNIELIVLGDESVQELGELLFEDAQDCLGKYRQCIQALRVLRASLEMNAFPLGIILLKSREILR